MKSYIRQLRQQIVMKLQAHFYSPIKQIPAGIEFDNHASRYEALKQKKIVYLKDVRVITSDKNNYKLESSTAS